MLKSNLLLFAALTAALLSPALFGQTQQAYTISTIAGTGTNGYSGDGGSATSAQIGGPYMVAVDSSGNVYFADQYNNRIRKISSGSISTVAGKGTNGYSGDGSSATNAELSHPEGVTVDSSGNIYIGDTTNYCIRKVSGSNISTFAGNHNSGLGYAGDGGSATVAQLSLPVGVALDGSGNLYIADTSNNVIRRVTTDGNIATFAGNGTPGLVGDGGPATSANLNDPETVAIDSAGNLYIADTLNNVIRKVSTGGTITTIAGNGDPGYSGDGGPATQAELYLPRGVAVDATGNVYIADTLNSVIRVVGVNGIISTIAGNGNYGFSGDGGPATSGQLFFPAGIAVDGSGNIYVADNQNNRIRELTPVAGALPVVSGVIGASAFGAFNTVAPGSWIEIYGSNLSGITRPWGSADFDGSSAPTSLSGISVTIGGVPAYVSYISSTQVDAQVPFSVGAGSQPITVANDTGTSSAGTVTINSMTAGLLEPPSFLVSGVQYTGATFTDFTTFVLPTGLISGVTSKPASPGDTIIFFGVGFGAASPDVPAGQIAGQASTITGSFSVTIGGVDAEVSYAGVSPGSVGLYQFNVVVPQIPATDHAPVQFTFNGTNGPQTLSIAIQN